MRFAKCMWQLCLTVAVATAVTGCASVNAPPPVAPAAPVPTLKPAEPVVSPITQRTFDEANRALKEGKMEQAERGYRSVLQSNPELGGPHANLGVIYRAANRLPEALAEFTQAVRLSPKQPIYLNQLGVTYRLLGQFEKAREAYENAIALDANYAKAILNLGVLHDMYLSDGKRALALYIRYLALMPNGDVAVTKWVAELKNRKPAAPAATPKEKT